MAEYIKSHSNYVIKSKHQDTNDGTIYERDITTIGGLNQFAKGQVPIYKSSNFIITVNNDITNYKTEIDDKWEESPNGEYWTLDKNVTNQNDTNELQFKKDFYKLKDYAYYGSCSELIRASIVNIINTFPGELYSPIIDGSGLNVNYYDYSKSIQNPTIKVLGGEDNYLFDNPFNINIYTTNINSTENQLLYFANNGYKNYQIIKDGISYDITNWTVESVNKSCFKSGDKLADVSINDIKIEVWMGNDEKIFYLTSLEYLDYHIRPKQKYIDSFYNNLDSFEKILLNKDSNPKYTAMLEITYDDENGSITEIKPFTFPVSYGNYNLDIYSQSYDAYLYSLQNISQEYDETISDNLYRKLTHESIKNFDWSLNRNNDNTDDYSDYLEGGNKFAKMIRVIGRELDEIKLYIDNIKDLNTINYNSISSYSENYLKILLSNEGWDIKTILPLILEEYIIYDGKKEYINDASIDNEKTNTYIKDDISYKLFRNFKLNENFKITPFSKKYSKYPSGYFYKCDCETNSLQKVNANNEKYLYDECSKMLRNQISDYLNEKEYTAEDAKNFFFKILKLNSRFILSHKGTYEGIEMLLALFNLKSQRWIDSLSKLQYQNFIEKYNNDVLELMTYNVSEFTTITNGIEDKWNEEKGMNQLNWYNSTKLISYNTNEYKNGVYVDYQGLPLKVYYENDENIISNNKTNEKNSNILYPYFNKDTQYDGNMYYQMNGGWLLKFPYQFDNDNNILSNESFQYTETLKLIKKVKNLIELTSIPLKTLKSNDIVYVDDISINYLIIDGLLYDIYQDTNNNRYIKLEVNNGVVNVGNLQFTDELIVSDIYGESTINDILVTKYILNDLENSSEIKVYIINNQCIIMSEYQTISNYTIFENGKSNEFIELPTNYFILNNPSFKNEISINGWRQLEQTDNEYLRINAIKNYYKGNNPHSGFLNYDNGSSYLRHFEQLFKYSIDNNLFDTNCYSDLFDEYNEDMSIIASTGFKTLNPNQYTQYNTINDNKIHYFGDIKKQNGSKITYSINKPSNINEYNLCDLQPYKLIVDNVDYKKNDSVYNEDIVISSTNLIKGFEFNGVLEQIINLKNVSIYFKFINDDAFLRKNIELIKYIDDVIVFYLSQIIPSTIIPSIEYKYNQPPYFFVQDTTGIFAFFANAYVENSKLFIKEDLANVKENKLLMGI